MRVWMKLPTLNPGPEQITLVRVDLPAPATPATSTSRARDIWRDRRIISRGPPSIVCLHPVVCLSLRGKDYRALLPWPSDERRTRATLPDRVSQVIGDG